METIDLRPVPVRYGVRIDGKRRFLCNSVDSNPVFASIETAQALLADGASTTTIVALRSYHSGRPLIRASISLLLRISDGLVANDNEVIPTRAAAGGRAP